MSTNRRTIRRAGKGRITPEAVALFRQCEDIRATGCDEYWEHEGGRRREYLDASKALDQLLGLPPWAFGPCEMDLDEPKPSYLVGSGLCSAPTWDVARELRRELLAAAAKREVLQ